MMAGEEHSIIRRLIFRLVKKHVAGSTTASVIKAAVQLSSKGMHPTITFLNDHVATQLNARYNINAYAQLARQLSRLNIAADLSVRLSQLGYMLDSGAAVEGIDEILTSLGKGSKLWIESEPCIPATEPMRVCESHKDSEMGFEMPAALLLNGSSAKYLGTKSRYVKLTTYEADTTHAVGKPKANATATKNQASAQLKGEQKHSGHHADMVRLFTDSIDRLAGKCTGITVFSQDEKFMERLLKANRGHRKNLAFEVPLGYNAKRVNALMKSKANVGVYVSYGKDWIPYAINRLTEGRIRDIAMKLLDGEHKVGSNAEQQGH
jgi:proline dehydrogenase